MVKYMMMTLIIYLSYAQTLWLKMHFVNVETGVSISLSHYPEIFLKHFGMLQNDILLTTTCFGPRRPSKGSNEITE